MSCYHFKKTGTVIASVPGMPEPGPYFISLLDMRGRDSFPFDFALYFSTDHQNGPGGIWLYVCNGAPTHPGNWLSFDDARAAGHFDHLPDTPAANPVFRSTMEGKSHTETPHVQLVDGKVYLTYHNYIKGSDGVMAQQTLLAISPDGINFEPFSTSGSSVVLPHERHDRLYGRNSGYFRWGPNPYPGIHKKYAGYALHLGGDNWYTAFWTSDNARDWQREALQKGIEGLAVEDPAMIIGLSGIDPASIRPLPNGEFAALCHAGTRASGFVERVAEIYEIYLAGDGITFTRNAVPLLQRGKPGSDDTEELATPTSVMIGDEIHLLYVGTRDHAGVNSVMGAVGYFDPAGTLPKSLPDGAGNAHIMPAYPFEPVSMK